MIQNNVRIITYLVHYVTQSNPPINPDYYYSYRGVGVGIKEGITGGLSTGLRAKEYVSQLLLQKNNPRSTSADNLDRIS